MNSTYKAGSWNAICDVCGFKFKADQIRKRWDNLMVCNADYELPNPLMYIQVPADKPNPPWVRPDSDDRALLICTLATSIGIAGVGIAGCLRAGVRSYF